MQKRMSKTSRLRLYPGGTITEGVLAWIKVGLTASAMQRAISRHTNIQIQFLRGAGWV